MAVYIKANKKVAQYLGLTTERNQLSDGNYLLWQADMLRFGPLWKLGEILAQIGGLSLTHTEAREEQDGVKLRSLPEATDVRFKTESATATTHSYTDNAGDAQATANATQTDSNQLTSGDGAENDAGDASGRADEANSNDEASGKDSADGNGTQTDSNQPTSGEGTDSTDETDGSTDDRDGSSGTDEASNLNEADCTPNSNDETDGDPGCSDEADSTDGPRGTDNENGPDNDGPTTAGSGEDDEESDEADTDNEENDVTKEENHG
jgi:hypothetical protein